MKRSEYFLPTLKENPSDAVVNSHQLMIRSGMIRKTGAGLYLYLPYGLALLNQVEEVIRQEMNSAGASECKMPLLIPKRFLLKSNRWAIFKNELFRIKNEKAEEYALSPTNEENFTQLVLEEIFSYKDLPINLYQINHKFRDEIRPRFGVMRGKEFVMKDAYSFDFDDDSLEKSYQKMKKTYTTIFTKLGLNFVAVKADSGAMGGQDSEEFMVLTNIGEETIINCNNCPYAANIETADEIPFPREPINSLEDQELTKVATPDTRTIKDVCLYLKKDVKDSVKARVYSYQEKENKKLALVLIRGDYEVNETKLVKVLATDEIFLAEDEEIEEKLKTKVGFIGGINIPQEIKVIVDETIHQEKNLVMGANEKDFHFTGVSIERDLTNYLVANVYTAKGEKGSACPNCGEKALTHMKGIEIGHIFKLGQKYLRDFKVKVKNPQGKDVYPTMGCYGIGVNRLLAAIIEQSHDQEGIILPAIIAPFKVVVLIMDVKNPALVSFAEEIYEELKKTNCSPLLDDRKESPGFKFKDANLIGIPYQIIVGKKNQLANQVEFVERKSLEKKVIAREEIIPTLLKKISQ